VGEEMDGNADVHPGMVEVGVCTGIGIVSGAGMSSNDTSTLSLDEVTGSKSCGG